MSRRFMVVTEAIADFTHATELADRVLVERVEWLEDDLLDSNREWVGTDGEGARLTWASIAKRAREAGIRVHGHFDNAAAQPDAQAARRAIAYLRLHLKHSCDAIVLVRDQDDQPARREGLEQARGELATPHPQVVLGVANSERECWVLSGFDPRDSNERSRIDAERQLLGFHPCEQSHELTACKRDGAKRSPKRVLAALIPGDRDRERACWRETPLAVLRSRGARNGLADYLLEVADRLAPLIRSAR